MEADRLLREFKFLGENGLRPALEVESPDATRRPLEVVASLIGVLSRDPRLNSDPVGVGEARLLGFSRSCFAFSERPSRRGPEFLELLDIS